MPASCWRIWNDRVSNVFCAAAITDRVGGNGDAEVSGCFEVRIFEDYASPPLRSAQDGYPLLRGLFCGDPVDDSLHKEHIEVEVPGEVRNELCDEVSDGICSQSGSIARAGGGPAGIAIGNVGIADGFFKDASNQVRIVQHSFAIVALGPNHLIKIG